MAKGIREKIKLVSSAGTGHFYTTTLGNVHYAGKLELKNSIQLFVSTHLQRSENQIISLDATKTRSGGVLLSVCPHIDCICSFLDAYA